MKKIFLAILLSAITFSCSSDDESDKSKCDIQIYQIGTQNEKYYIEYGTDRDNAETHEVSQSTYNYYRDRVTANNTCWEGEPQA